VILMTDGENTMYSTADGAYGYTAQNHTGMTSTPYTDTKAAQQLDTKLAQICTNMKAEGIIVYTVVFDLNSTTVDDMMRTCASQPDYYFNSPDAASLRQAFRTIGDSLSNLRISK
jgi:glycine cleavage system aminomethyltransferase T